MGRARRPRSAGRSRVARMTIAASSGASLWVPEQLRGNGLEWWLDASVSSTIEFDGPPLVNAWRDRSGNSRHAEQTVSLDMPTYSATGWRGSKPAILFGSGTSEYMMSSTLGASGTWDFFVVYQHSHTAIASHSFLRNSANNTYVPIALSGDATSNVFRINGTDNPAGLEAYKNGSTTPLTRTRAAMFSDISTVNSPNGCLMRFGSVSWSVATAIDRLGTNGAYGIHGPVAEIVAVLSSVSAGNKQRIEGYLAHKWMTGTELAVGHPFRNEPPKTNS